MTARGPLWAVGLAGSALAHAVLLAGLAITLQPKPVPQQPIPESTLEVQSHQLERSQARAQPARGDPATEAQAQTTGLSQGAIPFSRARPVAQPPRLQLGAAATNAAPVPAKAPAAQVLAAAPAMTPSVAFLSPPAQQLRADPVPQRPVAAQAPTPQVTLASNPVPPVVAAQLAPRATPATSAKPQPAVWAAAQPDAHPAPEAPPQATMAPETAPQAQQITAALAFNGADGDVDPLSLAAFQSFVRPGDVTPGADPLRDGVAGVLSRVPCSRLQVSFDPETTTLSVNGHVPENDLRVPVLQALRAQMGTNITVSDNMLILPRPQCGALSGIANVGLPQSTDQITNPLLIGADTHARVFRFAEGRLLSLDMTAPDYDAYIYLDYFDAGGEVLHIEPNDFAPLRFARAKEAQQIGARTMQDHGLKLVVGPPFGQEIAVAFAASEPLYEGLRPIAEPAAPYLEWLREQVAEKRRQSPDFKGEWVYFFVATSAR